MVLITGIVFNPLTANDLIVHPSLIITLPLTGENKMTVSFMSGDAVDIW